MNILESINSAVEKQLNESVQLGADIPYMMRHNGEVLEISFSKDGLRDHPYVVDRVRRTSAQFLSDTLHDKLPCLKWFYKNTQSDALKEDIQAFYQCLIKSNFEDLQGTELEDQISKEFDLPTQHEASGLTYSLEDARTELDIIEQSTNQEFLRFRLQRSSQGFEMFCRISSKDFNWYDNLCKFIFDHYNQLSTITVSNDVFTGVENQPKTYKGQPIVYLPVREFVSFGGRPILEKLNVIQGIFDGEFETSCKHYALREGKLPSDSRRFTNPRLVLRDLQFMQTYCQKQLKESLHLFSDHKLVEGILNVKPDTPYMLRLNGDAIQVKYPETSIADHPYILDLLTDDVDIKTIQKSASLMKVRCFEWFYNNTSSQKLREAIQNYFKCILNNSEELNLSPTQKEEIIKRFNIESAMENRDPFMNGSLDYCLKQLPIINFDANQEFLRFRAQKDFGSKCMLMFRISSKGVDWYNAICKFIMDNYVQIGHIIISYDQQAGRGANTLTYRNQSLSFMEVEDFLTLKGTPVLEQLHKVMGDLTGVNLNESLQIREGMLLHDSCAYCNPNSINRLVEKLTQLTEEYQK